jgi:hypothetical protein
MTERLRLLPAVVRTAQTLSYAHEHGVIHRDVKPDNVIVGPHGDVVLLDWGIARARGFAVDNATGEEPRAPEATAYGAVVGTPAYMSPEQAAGRTDDIDERSDVFALGALLYHVLAGRMPYSGLNVEEVLASAREARSRPVLEVEPNVPAPLAAICARAMSRLPQERYRNASELARALEEFESNAVLVKPGSRVLTIAVNALTSLAVGAAVMGSLALLSQIPSFEHMGNIAYVIVTLAMVGTLVSVVEWATRGRYTLSSLGLAFALGTVCATSVSISLGYGHVFGALKGLVRDAEQYRALFAEGSWEVMGGATLGGCLSAVQFLLWGVAKRRVLAAREAPITARAARTTGAL